MRNLRYSLRTLARTPGFTLTAVLTLALGIGASTAMMAIVNSVLFTPLPFSHPDRLYIATTEFRPLDGGTVGPGGGITRFPVNARHFHEWRRQCASCEDVALVGGNGLTLTGAGAPDRLVGLDVSYNFFRTLGVHAQLGRDFTPEDEGPAGYHVVLLSDALWRSRFGADPSIIGRSLQLNGQAHTVVGVMPRDLHLPRGAEWGAFFAHNLTPLVFRPFGLDLPTARPMGQFNYIAVVRTRAGVSLARAQAEMTGLITNFSREAGVNMSAILTPMGEQVTGGARRPLWILLAGVVAVLTLVSFNVGGLLLVRNISRARDASIRVALGATPSDLLRPMLTDVMLIVGGGGALGAGLAVAGIRAFVAAAPVDLPRIGELRPDWRILAFALAASATAAALAAVAPAWRLLRVDLQASLGSATRSATETKGRLQTLDLIMIAEVAVSTTVLVLGTLLATSFLNVLAAERGFETRNVVTQALSLSGPRYAPIDARNVFIAQALDKFRALPGVVMAGEVSQLPLRGETWVDALLDADRPRDAYRDQPPLVNRRFVSPGYFAAMGIELKAGRDVSESDRDRPVALLSERAARLLWPHDDPIGKHVGRANTNATPPSPAPADVIGVVADVRTVGLEQQPAPMLYEPYWHVGPTGPAFVFRTDRDARSLAADIRGAVNALDRDLPVPPPQTMQAIVSDSAALRRFQATLVGVFSLVALLIAAIGLYGLVSFVVARRTRELGLRIALGATSGRIAAMVVRRGMRPVIIGGLIGLVAAIVGGNLLVDQLYGIGARDPQTLAGVIVALSVVGITACWIPAWRATKVDPMISLRAE